jgi:hypothetical protein
MKLNLLAVIPFILKYLMLKEPEVLKSNERKDLTILCSAAYGLYYARQTCEAVTLTYTDMK